MKVRFAPSPTGYLHIGNVRTALVNWLYARNSGGVFMLRSDDTDEERSKKEYEVAIEEDLRWLGLDWDEYARQSDRYDRYELAKQKLIADGRLYACYETQEELDIKRKMLLSRGLPPLYDRAGQTLTAEQKAAYEAEGRIAHWRFVLKPEPIRWTDEVRGEVAFEGDKLSDPILLREDGRPTYTLSSVVDDGELGITHVIRGEDHVSNTAVQAQLFEALGFAVPTFAHLALIKTKEGGMSKREGGHDIRSLREAGLESMAITSLLARIGTSQPIEPQLHMQALVDGFSIGHFGRNTANYDQQELERINAKIVSQLSYAEVAERLKALGLDALDEAFWLAIRPNLTLLPEAADWWKLCNEQIAPEIEDAEFAEQAAALLPAGVLTLESWGEWTGKLKDQTGRKGKQLFMPLRKALTGREHGPDMRDMLPLIGREKAEQRLRGKAA